MKKTLFALVAIFLAIGAMSRSTRAQLSNGGVVTNVTGPGASGAAATGNPVRIAGKDGSSATQDLTTILNNAEQSTGQSLLNTAAVLYTFDNASTVPIRIQNGKSVGNAADGSRSLATISYGQYNTATQTPGAATYSALQTDSRGNMLVSLDHVNRFSCPVPVSTATTIQAFGGSCVAPGASLSLYITDVNVSTNASGIAADTFMTIKSGTGGTCGSNTAVVWAAFTAAAAQANVVEQLVTPIKITANNELCWINSTAGSKFLVVNGYIAP
jgi:hypothetical protein